MRSDEKCVATVLLNASDPGVEAVSIGIGVCILFVPDHAFGQPPIHCRSRAVSHRVPGERIKGPLSDAE